MGAGRRWGVGVGVKGEAWRRGETHSTVGGAGDGGGAGETHSTVAGNFRL